MKNLLIKNNVIQLMKNPSIECFDLEFNKLVHDELIYFTITGVFEIKHKFVIQAQQYNLYRFFWIDYFSYQKAYQKFDKRFCEEFAWSL